jgi:hypothetical protein
VQQRLARVVGVPGEIPPGDAADEAPRVVLGQAGQGEQGAVAGVEHDRGGRRGRVGAAPLPVGQPAGGPHAVGQGPLDTHLEVEVEGQLEVAAGGRGAAAQGPHHLPGRIDLEVLDAVAAAEPLVIGQLDPGLADDVAGRVPAEPPVLQLLGRDLADVAEHVGGGRPGRVLAQGQHLGGDPGEAVGVLGQVEEPAGGDVLGHRDATQGRPGVVGDPRLQPGPGGAEQAGQAAQDLAAAVAEQRRLDRDRPGGPVADHHPPAGVQDPASRRLDHHLADPVPLGQVAVALAGQHLEVPQARGQGDQQQRDQHRQRQQAGAERGGRVHGRATYQRWAGRAGTRSVSAPTTG